MAVPELLEALALETGNTVIDKEDMPTPELLMAVCHGLVEINPNNNEVQLVHDFVRDGFREAIRSRQYCIPSECVCLTYLLSDEFAIDAADDRAYDSIRKKRPFLSYVAHAWPHHLGKSNKPESMDLLVQLLDPTKPNLNLAWRVYWDYMDQGKQGDQPNINVEPSVGSN